MRCIVSCGDPNSIGYEILLSCHRDYPETEITAVGSSEALAFWEQHTGITAQFQFIDVRIPGKPVIGKESDRAGAIALASIEAAYHEAKKSCLPLVTLPVSKHAIAESCGTFTGHTEYLAQLDGKREDEVVMLLGGERLKVVTLTRHIPLIEVSKALTRETIEQQATLVHRWFTQWKGRTPKMKLAGLNPHAGEGGTIGTEEIAVIIPALLALRQQGISISGPHPADTMFREALEDGTDVCFACYHDQGLGPLKLIHFDDGVNVTIGLSIIRTSVDHGTAFSLAGKGLASYGSFKTAVDWAIDMAKGS